MIAARPATPGRSTFLRSSAKPIQALPLVRARPDLDDREIAIACASHLGRPEQLEAVRSLLAAAPAGEARARDRAGADADRATTAPASTPAFSRSAVRAAGTAPATGCRDIRCSRRCWRRSPRPRRSIPRRMPTATDGCGVLDVRAAARPVRAPLRAACPSSTAGARVDRARCVPTPRCCAARSRPTRCSIGALDGWVAKGGAEGLFCACSPDGLGVALKVEDGAFRAIRPALAAFLGGSASRPASSASSPVENSRGEVGRGGYRASLKVVFPNGRSACIGFAACKGLGPVGESGNGSHVRRARLRQPTRRKPRFMLSVEIALPDVEELHKLVEQGQEKGFLTYDEIVNALEDVELTKEQIEDFYHVPDRPLDRAGRGRAAQAAAARAAGARRGREGRRRSSTSRSSRRSTRSGSTCGRSARCRCSPPTRRSRSRSASSAATCPRSST